MLSIIRRITFWLRNLFLKSRLTLVLITSVVSIAGTVALQEVSKHYVAKYFSDSTLTYQITSVSRLRQHELPQYAEQELGRAFNLQLDDPIITEYGLFKVTLRNPGQAIQNGFKLQATIGQGDVKIIDVAHVVRFPLNKSIPVVHTLPNLKWTMNVRSEVVIGWTPPQDNAVFGYHLYRSTLRDVGFGRINARLITQSCVAVNVKDLRPGYYAVATVGLTGNMSKLSRPVKYPEIMALQPTFKDVIWVHPDTRSTDHCEKQQANTYRTIKDAAVRGGDSKPILVRKRRNDALSTQNLERNYYTDKQIFYEDDLDFLRGQVDVSFPNGLDEGGEIDFYFLTKPIPGSEASFDLILKGDPTIKLVRRSEKSDPTKPSEQSGTDKKKQSLTPSMVTTLVDNENITLIWTKINDTSYKGVRIFRTVVANGVPPDQLGEEIYDGPTAKGTVECRMNRNVTVAAKPPLSIYPMPEAKEPPRRKNEKIKGSPPAAPGALRMEGLAIIPENVTINYFRDGPARSTAEYKYTSYTFDDRNNYSYPVEVRASMLDRASGLSCAPMPLK